MKYAILATALVTLAPGLYAQSVTGAAEGFARGVTGGGNATPVRPTTNAELISYLRDNVARVIVIDREFNFIGSEGTDTLPACSPWGTGSLCQKALNKDNWCVDVERSPITDQAITFDKAGMLAMTVGSNKSIIGVGNRGVLRGKGLRIVSGARNVIIQNIRITNINPNYVWGGDAITLDNTDLVWIDHVTTDLIARQHIVLGPNPSGRVTISNSDINGATTRSATCDNHHYWTIYFTGSNDRITMKGNYIRGTSGRSPKVAGNTVLHAVNNYWFDNSGHAFEAGSNGQILIEGNVFQNVLRTKDPNTSGARVFAAPNPTLNSQCSAALGRACQLNAYGSSPALTDTDTSIFSAFSGQDAATAASTDSIRDIPTKAGYGKI